MKKEKIKPLVKGFIEHIPGVKELLPNKTGGTITSRYCYSVWMRHLINCYEFDKRIPENVAELGPGDSLGTGLASLLSGSKQLHVLDVYKYWDNQRNLQIFEELIVLFRNKANIPDNKEWPKVKPELNNYTFPSYILSDELLNETLAEERLNAIRKEIMGITNPGNSFIKCHIPWNDTNIISDESIDFIFSQAVLQHVEELDNTYKAMRKWLKPSGLMSHTIDFKSMRLTTSWNGHWLFSDFEWKIVKGGKEFLINRQPFSKHLELHSKNGFHILINRPSKTENQLDRKEIAEKFRNLSEEDITTSGTYILSKKEFSDRA